MAIIFSVECKRFVMADCPAALLPPPSLPFDCDTKVLWISSALV